MFAWRCAQRADALLSKQILNVFKRLELDGVARRVKEEHGGLFAGFAFEADVWLDDEFGAGGLQAVSQFVPLLHGEHDTEVTAGDVVAVHLGGLRH